MNDLTRQELRLRLRLAFSHEPAAETRASHIASIEAALTSAPAVVRPGAKAVRFRRWVAVVTVAATSLSPVGVAVAAERALPGDKLYEVKLVAERVRSVIDPLVTARHRVDELELLIERGADPSVIEIARLAAWAAADDLVDGHPLLARLRHLEERLVEPTPGETSPSGDEPPSEAEAPAPPPSTEDASSVEELDNTGGEGGHGGHEDEEDDGEHDDEDGEGGGGGHGDEGGDGDGERGNGDEE